jgi:hypothetical protein
MILIDTNMIGIMIMMSAMSTMSRMIVIDTIMIGIRMIRMIRMRSSSSGGSGGGSYRNSTGIQLVSVIITRSVSFAVMYWNISI